MTQTGPILIVDDDLDIRDTLAQILEFEGFSVSCAANGREALEVLADASRPRPQLILLDLMMPVMNGLEFRERQVADAALAAIPVIVLSADGNLMNKAKAAGIARYMRKPIELEALIREVRSQI